MEDDPVWGGDVKFQIVFNRQLVFKVVELKEQVGLEVQIREYF